MPEGRSRATLLRVIDTVRRTAEDAAVFNESRKDDPMQATTTRHDTKAWKLQVWISFGLAVLLCATGLADLPGADLDRAFMVMGYMFCLSSAFALARYVRDNEARRLGNTPDTPTAANIAFDDHPGAKRFTDRIETVTVDSVFAWLNRSGLGGPVQVIR